MANPTTTLLNNPFQNPSFSYPGDLGSVGQEPYMIFQIRPSVSEKAPVIGTIAMYMPASIKVNYKSQWYEFNDSWRQLTDFFQDLGEGGLGESLADAASHTVARVVNSVSPSRALGEKYRSMWEKKVLNPHMALLFQGIEPRTFTFEFQMFAKNAKDCENIAHIIQAFKFAMHPADMEEGGQSGGPKRWFHYPENFLIGLFSPEDRYLFKIGVSILDSMEVDYAGSSIPSFFYANGAPVHIKMSLTFRETELMTKSTIAKGY